MKEFKNKVAVITGGASGIGKAIAERCSAEGMKVVIADIEESALKQFEKELSEKNSSVLSVVTDVSKLEDIKNLAEKTLDKFGSVHLLFNNAGVGTGGLISQQTMKDFKWVLDVNLWGVIYGMHVFLPIMKNQDKYCHIVNTSSAAGIIPGLGVYGITKFGVTALTEMFAAEFKNFNSKVKISVLYPGIVNTKIAENYNRNRPVELQNPEIAVNPDILKELGELFNNFKALYSGPNAMSAKTVADIVFHAIENKTLFIFTDLASETAVKKRADAMLSDMKVLRQFIKTSGQPEAYFLSELMDEGYKNAY